MKLQIHPTFRVEKRFSNRNKKTNLEQTKKSNRKIEKRKQEIDCWFYNMASYTLNAQSSMLERIGSSWCTFILPIFCYFSLIFNTSIKMLLLWLCVCAWIPLSFFRVCFVLPMMMMRLLRRFCFSFIHHRTYKQRHFSHFYFFILCHNEC